MYRSLFPMQPKFKVADESEKYLSHAKRAKYLSTINECGQLLNHKGELLTDDTFMYVVSDQLELYVVPTNRKFNHSFILAGASVLAAGFLQTDEAARIIHLNNNSGHYCPTMKGMLFVINYLYEKSCSYATCIPEFENHDQIPSSGVITTYDMSDLLNQTNCAEHEASFEENLKSVFVISRNDSKANIKLIDMEGYESAIDSAKKHTPRVSSHFGCGPKGWSKTMGLFSVNGEVSSRHLSDDLLVENDGCRAIT